MMLKTHNNSPRAGLRRMRKETTLDLNLRRNIWILPRDQLGRVIHPLWPYGSYLCSGANDSSFAWDGPKGATRD